MGFVKGVFGMLVLFLMLVMLVGIPFYVAVKFGFLAFLGTICIFFWISRGSRCQEPKVFTPQQVKNWEVYCLKEDGHTLCRDMRMTGFRLFYRLKLSWGVFTGKFDVLHWEAE